MEGYYVSTYCEPFDLFEEIITPATTAPPSRSLRWITWNFPFSFFGRGGAFSAGMFAHALSCRAVPRVFRYSQVLVYKRTTYVSASNGGLYIELMHLFSIVLR